MKQMFFTKECTYIATFVVNSEISPQKGEMIKYQSHDYRVKRISKHYEVKSGVVELVLTIDLKVIKNKFRINSLLKIFKVLKIN